MIAYDDGEVRQQFALCFRARPTGGTLRSSDESREARWVDPGQLDALNVHSSMRMPIDHGLAASPTPYIG